MSKKNCTVIDTPIGKLGIQVVEDYITSIDFLHQNTALVAPACSLSKKTVTQLNQYFANPETVFDLPLYFNGTPFQQRIWHYLATTLTSGTTITYGELAKLFHTSARAIGNACRRNPIPIIVPCHRVLAKNHLGGFSGQKTGKLMNIKHFLLTHEQSI